MANTDLRLTRADCVKLVNKEGADAHVVIVGALSLALIQLKGLKAIKPDWDAVINLLADEVANTVEDLING